MIEYAEWYHAEDGREVWLVTNSGKLLDVRLVEDRSEIGLPNVPGTVIGLPIMIETSTIE